MDIGKSTPREQVPEGRHYGSQGNALRTRQQIDWEVRLRIVKNDPYHLRAAWHQHNLAGTLQEFLVFGDEDILNAYRVRDAVRRYCVVQWRERW